MNIEDILGN